MLSAEGYSRDLSEQLASAGLDLVHPFRLDASLDPLFPFPRFGREACLGVLVANSRALWPPFVRWFQAHPGQHHSELHSERLHSPEAHPLNAYVTEKLRLAIGDVEHALFLAHLMNYATPAGPSAVPIQRLGQAVGFASLGPAHLSVHPQCGPWFAYRAVLAFNLPPPSAAKLPRTAPCDHCPAPCAVQLRQVLAQRPPSGIEQHWQEWLQVRDACPEQRAARYSENQVRYHYTKDRAFLRL